MPIVDNSEQVILAQRDFSGGLNQGNTQSNQYRDSLNIVIRDGRPTTRPGVRRHLRTGGWQVGFYFNQENSKQNDALHTGFWFDFDFVRNVQGTIQGCELIRLSIHTENKIIFAVGGAVFIYEDGYLTEISATFGSDEQVKFVQAIDKVYMFRSGDNQPLVWDGSDTGFIDVPDPDPTVGAPIPHGATGVYHAGRMWVPVDDDVYASNLLEPSVYDLVYRAWSVNKGEGEYGVTLFPFHEDILLGFKKRRTVAFGQINAVIVAGTNMSDYVLQNSVDEKTGAVAPDAIVSNGEDVWYLGYGGIYSLSRNAQNRTQLAPIAVSEPIKSFISRINPDAVSGACAVAHDNYIIFAVPVDGSTTNNMLLVYDKLVNAWVGPWTGPTLNPMKFFHDNEKLVFLSADGFVRVMFTNDPWDSEHPYEDVETYDPLAIYEAGEVVYYSLAGDRLYKAVQTTQGNLPTDTTYWVEVTDVWGMYAVRTEIETRQFRWSEETAPVKFSRAQVTFEHQNPNVTLIQKALDYGTEKTIYADIVYPQTKYDVVVNADWDETNENNDFAVPNRKDYTLNIGLAGIYCYAEGLMGGIWERHMLRWLPITVNVQGIGVKFSSSRGMVRLNQVQFMGSPRRMAAAEIV